MVFRRMLPDVERGEMKPDEIDEASNSSQAPVGDQGTSGGKQRAREHVEVVDELGGSGVRTRPGGCFGRLQKSLVHHREPLAVRLSRTQCSEASPDLREVFVVGGELRFKLRGDGSHRSRDAQLGGQCFDLRDQEAERSGPLEVEYLAGGVGCDVRIAVTITTDPRSEAHRLRTRGEAEPVSERAQGRVDVVEEFGNPFLKHLAEEVEDRPRLVDWVGLLATKLIGLPDHVEEFVDTPVNAADHGLLRLAESSLDQRGDLGELVQNAAT